MFYLFSQYWVWMVAAFILGGFIGWLTHISDNMNWFKGWVIWTCILSVIMIITVFFKIFNGRYELFIETTLLLFFSYIIGCWLFSFFKSKMFQTNLEKTHSVDSSQVIFADPAKILKNDDNHPGSKPAALATPINDKADDLKRIKGIGKQNEQRLNALGIWHFSQIAEWTSDQVSWVGSYLSFVGRIERENWVEQAKILAHGKETEFSKRVDAGEVPTSSNQA